MRVDLPDPDTPVTQVNRPGRNAQGHLAQVVAGGPHQPDDPLRVGVLAAPGQGDAAPAGEILAGERSPRSPRCGRACRRPRFRRRVAPRPDRCRRCGPPCGSPPRRARRRARCCAEVAEVSERAQQAGVVALVQADRRLVQDVHDAHEPGPDLACETDALGLAAGQRLGAPVQGEVVQADVDEEAEPGADLLDDLLGDGPRAPPSSSSCEKYSRGVLDGTRGESGGPSCRRCRRGGLPRERRAPPAGGTRTDREVLLQALPYGRRLGFLEAALHVGDDALEGVPAVHLVAPVVDVAEVDAVAARAEQDGVLLSLAELPEGRVHLEVRSAARGTSGGGSSTRCGGPIRGWRRRRRSRRGRTPTRSGIEVLLDAEPVALPAGADRVLLNENSRGLEFTDAVAALRAREPRGEDQVLRVALDETHHRDALGQFQGRLERLGQALLHVGPHAQAVDHGLDGVFPVLCRAAEGGRGPSRCRRCGARMKPFAVKILKDVQVLALAVGDHRRRSQHDCGCPRATPVPGPPSGSRSARPVSPRGSDSAVRRPGRTGAAGSRRSP